MSQEEPSGIDEVGARAVIGEGIATVRRRVEPIDGMQEHVQPLEGRDGPAQMTLGKVQPLEVAGDLQHGLLGQPGLALDGLHPPLQPQDRRAGPGDVRGGNVGQIGLLLDGRRDGLVEVLDALIDGRAEGGQGRYQGGLGLVVAVEEFDRIEFLLLLFSAAAIFIITGSSSGAGTGGRNSTRCAAAFAAGRSCHSGQCRRRTRTGTDTTADTAPNAVQEASHVGR